MERKKLTVINDCHDGNALARQLIRYQSILGCPPPTFIGVNSEFEAQGNLIDVIDAHRGTSGIIVVNVAPRGDTKKYPNGSPFCYHKFGALTIIGTPGCFSLAKRLGLFEKTKETDVYETSKCFLGEKEARRISNSQFRSYEYLPHLASWVTDVSKYPTSKEVEIVDQYGGKNFIWEIDNFGNCKTTATAYDEFAGTKFGTYKFYERLADVPNDATPAIICGSSGHNEARFLEIVIQKGNAGAVLKLSIGDIL